MRCLLVRPDESNNDRVIGGEPCVAYGQCEKRDQAAANSLGHHAAVRAVVLAYALSLRNLEETSFASSIRIQLESMLRTDLSGGRAAMRVPTALRKDCRQRC